MILVLGATGMLGSEICRQLRAKFHHVKAMVRPTANPAKLKVLEDIGVHLIKGDLRDGSSFKDALHGTTTVFSTISSMPFSYVADDNNIENVDEKGMKDFIDEAAARRVKRFIYTSFSGNIDQDFPLRNAKRTVEKHLQQSGMIYTILRPGAFMEVWLSAAVGFDIDHGKVQVFGDGYAPISYISFKDVAHFALICLENVNARNAILELGGPEKLSQMDVVKLFEKSSGKKFQVHHIPKETLTSQMLTSADSMQKSFSGLMLCFANGDAIEMRETLEKFPAKLTSVYDYARQFEAVH